MRSKRLPRIHPQGAADSPDGTDDDEGGDDDRNALGDEDQFLFSQGLLPSYAFPTDLTSFLVERSAGEAQKADLAVPE